MGTIDFAKKYSSLSNATDVNPQAEVTDIGDKDFLVVQHGQRWHNRLACWIKDSTRAFFSPLRKNTYNTAWERLNKDLASDGSIAAEHKEFAATKIAKWQKEGVPLRVLHVRQLLRRLDGDSETLETNISVLPKENKGQSQNTDPSQQRNTAPSSPSKDGAPLRVTIQNPEEAPPDHLFPGDSTETNRAQSHTSVHDVRNFTGSDSGEFSDCQSGDKEESLSSSDFYDAQTGLGNNPSETVLVETEVDGETVRVDIIKPVTDSDQPQKELNATQMDDLADAMEGVPIPQKTVARPDVKVTTHPDRSETPRLDEVAEKWLADNGDWVQPEVYEAAEEVMNKIGIASTALFRRQSDENRAGRNKNTAADGIMTKFFTEIKDKDSTEMTPGDFKDNFRKAVLSYTFDKKEWFEHIGSELAGGGWDPAN